MRNQQIACGMCRGQGYIFPSPYSSTPRACPVCATPPPTAREIADAVAAALRDPERKEQGE